MADFTKAELAAKLAEANASLAQALETIDKLNNAVKTLTVAQSVQPVSNVHADVTIVWMVEWPGYLKGNNFEYHFSTAGEEIIMPRYVFDELVGKYRAWFNDGRLAVSYKNIDVALSKKLKTDKDYILNAEIISSLGSLKDTELKSLWDSLTTKNEKLSLVTAYKRGFIEEESGYRDISKVSLLNGLTGGGFARELDELSGKIKYQPIDLND